MEVGTLLVLCCPNELTSLGMVVLMCPALGTDISPHTTLRSIVQVLTGLLDLGLAPVLLAPHLEAYICHVGSHADSLLLESTVGLLLGSC